MLKKNILEIVYQNLEDHDKCSLPNLNPGQFLVRKREKQKQKIN